MPRYKCMVEYDGTNYHGWQVQKDLPSIQDSIELAIKKLSGENSRTYTAGRTDAGVHAVGQVFHFNLNKDFCESKLKSGLNHFLSNEFISILSADKTIDNFHARFSAKKRYYKYIIINRRAPLVLKKNRAWHVPWYLDFDAMCDAKNVLIGTHDFSSFRDTQCQASSPIKTIDNIYLSKNGDEITIDISAKSFLHHMVRIIVGSLEFVGREKWNKEDLKNALNEKKRSAGGPTAPACGLYFMNVKY